MWNFAMGLLSKGIVRLSPTIPKMVLSAFLREKTDNLPNQPKGYRFLVNGRPLKQFMDVPHFKLEDLISLVSQLKPGGTYHCVKIDLKDAYFCCPIPEEDQTYFGFSLLDPDNVRHYFVFCAICQGTSQSSYVFDRLLKPVLRHWRRNASGAMVIYVDDCLGAALSHAHAIHMRDVLIDALTKAGFIINWKKCVLDPTQTFTALGFTLDFTVNPATISPSPRRITTTSEAIKAILDLPNPHPTPRDLCSIGGKIVSMRHALGASSSLHLRSLYVLVCLLTAGTRGWDTPILVIPEAVLEELRYWFSRLSSPASYTRPLWPPRLPLPDGQAYLDASDIAVNALVRDITHLPSALRSDITTISNLLPPSMDDFIISPEGQVLQRDSHHFHYLIAVQDILASDQDTSSCARELFTIFFLLLCKGADWQDRTLQFFLDAHSIISILKKGSSSPIEHSLAIRIDIIVTHHNITIQYIWIPRRLNKASDLFSRFTDIDDYTLSLKALLNIISCLGIPMPRVDLFATTANTLCPNFYSRFYQIDCSGINTLALNLNGLHAYAFPPSRV